LTFLGISIVQKYGYEYGSNWAPSKSKCPRFIKLKIYTVLELDSEMTQINDNADGSGNGGGGGDGDDYGCVNPAFFGLFWTDIAATLSLNLDP